MLAWLIHLLGGITEAEALRQRNDAYARGLAQGKPVKPKRRKR